MAGFDELMERWAVEAENQRSRFLDEKTAGRILLMVQDLKEAVELEKLDLLTLSEAAEESGYSQSHLSRLIREGKIPNAGSEEGPGLLWKHCPRKPGFGVLDLDEIRGLSRREVVEKTLKQVN